MAIFWSIIPFRLTFSITVIAAVLFVHQIGQYIHTVLSHIKHFLTGMSGSVVRPRWVSCCVQCLRIVYVHVLVDLGI